jgi:hypothetical protein
MTWALIIITFGAMNGSPNLEIWAKYDLKEDCIEAKNILSADKRINCVCIKIPTWTKNTLRLP